jgi:cation diffusion facilitator family transporter
MKAQVKILLLSASVRSALAATKLTVAWMSGSIALTADALHSFCDVFVTVAVLASLLLSRIENRRFPNGLNKAEDLISLFISLGIVYVGYDIGRDALVGAAHDVAPAWPGLALAAALFDAAAMWALARYEKRVGLATGSPGVKADAFASLVVALGLLGEMAGVHLEWLAALLVAALIFAVGAKVFLDAVAVLLDGDLDAETLERARRVVASHPGVSALRAVHGRNSGNNRILQMVIGIRADDLRTAHDICDGLEERLQEQIPNLHQVLIHYEPGAEEAQGGRTRPDRPEEARRQPVTA